MGNGYFPTQGVQWVDKENSTDKMRIVGAYKNKKVLDLKKKKKF